MQYASTNNHSQDQTIFSLLSNGYGIERSASANVNRLEINQANQAPYLPWYAKIQTQTLNLTEETKDHLGFNPVEPYQPEVNDNSEFWQKLCLMGLDNGMLTEHDIGFLLEAPVGTSSQVKAAIDVGDKILSAYANHSAHCEMQILSKLNANGSAVGIQAEIRDWYTDPSKSCWGFELTLDDASCYGEDYDEFDRNFNGIGLRIEHCSRVSALNFKLDHYSAALGRVLYKTICLLAEICYKSNAIDYCDGLGDTSFIAKLLLEAKLTEEQICAIAQSDEESIGDVLLSINPILLEQFADELRYDPFQVINGAAYVIATTMTPWYCETKFNSQSNPQSVARQLRKELKKARPNSLNANEIEVKKTLDAVLQTVIELVHQNEQDSSWFLGSDCPLNGFAFVTFGSVIEEDAIEFENEHRQSVGEHGAIRLNLENGKAGFQTIENILLGDLCLLTLCSLN
ncbi:hypothetical protein [Shewanella sp. GD03713]|uniref:hypothetical protein n=1 Tax=Shewanella sp. GD03713 TaxID=2975372 RepID=UPI002447D06C|nr:hypothetical protein [Shewanella sp. GD03713]MDH1472564.1 hypothetical protein [Shewanella sp. GD03713]